MAIQWYPGHMHRAKKIIRENLSKVDIIIEVIDSRAPLSSTNPLVRELSGQKPRIILLNKSDLSDNNITAEWVKYFRSINEMVMPLAASKPKTLKQLFQNIGPQFSDRKWYKRRPVRALILGIPNVGKSTLINGLSGNKKAGVANTPGFTRDVVRYDTRFPLQLFDSPGILWPKIEDPNTGIKLASMGTIKDSILSMEEISLYIIDYLLIKYPEALIKRYGNVSGDSVEIMQSIGKSRGALQQGGVVDIEKVSFGILKDFREGRLGKISLESPQDIKNFKTQDERLS